MEKTFKQQLELAREGGLSIFDLQVGLEVEDQLSESETLSHISDDAFNAICGKAAQVHLKLEEAPLKDIVGDLIDRIIYILGGREPTKENICNIVNNNIDKFGQMMSLKMLNISYPLREKETINKSDFWLYSESHQTMFHITEGTGDNLDIEDAEEGYIDYIYFDLYDNIMFDNGDALSTIKEECEEQGEDDGGLILLKKPYTDYSIEEIVYNVLDFCYNKDGEDIIKLPVDIIK